MTDHVPMVCDAKEPLLETCAGLFVIAEICLPLPKHR